MQKTISGFVRTELKGKKGKVAEFMCLRKNNLSFSPSAAFFVAAAWRAGRVHPKLFLREKKGRREKNGAEGNFGLLELLYHGRREGGTRSFGPALLPPPFYYTVSFSLGEGENGPLPRRRPF